MLSLSDIVNVKVGIGRGVFEAPGATVIGGKKPSFNLEILKLFANGEQGFWYDPSDMGTMYQNAAGTIPVTGVGQPVGLVLDKSKGLLNTTIMSQTDTFDFTGGGTTPPSTNSNTSFLGKACVSVTFPQIASGGYTASRATGASHPITANTFYKYRFKYALSRKLEAGESLVVYVTGAYGASTIYPSPATPENVWIDAESTALVTLNGANSFAIYAAKTNSPITVYATAFSINAVDVGNYAFQTTSASRPILRQNANTGAYYLEFDGSDDFLVTNNIDFTATDKVSLFAGVRKLTDFSAQILVELSADQGTNSGSFVLMPRQSGIAEGASFRSRGSLNSTLNVVGLNAPLSTVFTAKANIQGDSSILRSNGVQVGELNADQGTGNYGNYPLYIGRRAGTSLPFNGHLYGLIGIGRLTTDSETKALEQELAKRTGVTLNV